MAPYAERPPFATDEPDILYQSSRPAPTRRQRQPEPVQDRTSAYDVYDSYFNNDAPPNRASGMDALGLGFMNALMDDDDEDDEDDRMTRKSSMKKSKHDMLAEATRERTPSPPPQYNIAQPRPGYVAPIASLDTLAKPDPVASPPGRRLQVNTGRPIEPSQSPSTPHNPHQLQQPLSPITPAFARPRPPKGSEVSFDEKAIIRGESEDHLIPRRGERGDDFWRRFSMVVRENDSKRPGQKDSMWLRKTQNGSNRLAAWVWIVGLILLLAAVGGIGIGVYTSHKSTSHNAPTAFGGSVGEKQSGSGAAGSGSNPTAVGSGNPSVHTSFHVSPSKTVARRDPMFTAIAAHRRDLRSH